MSFIKRAFLGIIRSIGKSLILLIVILILGNVISGAFSIQQATGHVEDTIKERLGASATFILDFDKIGQMTEQEIAEQPLSISIDLINEVGALSYVKYFDYNLTGHLQSNTINLVGSSYGAETYNVNDFMLKGINYAPIIDIEEEKIRLVDGRTFTQEEVDDGALVAIISKDLAETNDLSVGDTFTLANEIHEYNEMGEAVELLESRDLVLEIIGLFEPQIVAVADEGSSNSIEIDFENIDASNTIYLANDVVADENNYRHDTYMELDESYVMMFGDEDPNYYQPLFVLNHPDDHESFIEEVKPLLPETYKVNSAMDDYEKVAGPIASMSKLAKYVLYIAIAATVLIIGLVVLLFLRDRKHELGIYLSLGERRARVIGQIVIEVIVIAFIGLTVSLFSGNILADNISETMIQAEEYDEDDTIVDVPVYGEIQTNLTTEEFIDSYAISLDSNYILGFYIIGFLTVLLSTLIPLIYIVRLNPKQILM